MLRRVTILAVAVVLALPLGGATATAAPTRYEAESAASSACPVESNHTGFSGAGFVNCANASGQWVQWSVTAAAAGTATIALRYANGTTASRASDISVNGTVVAAATAFAGTGSWDTWATKTVTAPVTAGANTIRVTSTTVDGPPNLDFLDLDVAAAVPEVQAETCTVSQGLVESNHAGFTGTGFVNYDNVSGSYVQCSLSAPSAASYSITFRVSNGTTTNRPMSVTVNGAVAGTPQFGGTGNWDTWQDVSVTASLQAGANIVRASATTANGGPNLDRVSATPGGAPPSNPMAAAPYEYFGWGSPQDPVAVMNATGVKWFTLAFILSDGTCNPAWDGSRPLTGGNDQTQINRIRANGGDVMVSIGGWSGEKLGEHCTSASALAGAYQRVINAYALKAIDIDIENTEWASATVRQRVVDALKIIKQGNPSVKTIVTFGTTPTGPDSTGIDMINRGANSGLANDVWAVMPFDFGGHTGTMGQASVNAVEGLKTAVKNAYGYSDATAYAHVGLSSMNGQTDEAGETVTTADFTTILNYARLHHIARFAFWSVNRDRACGSGGDPDACSGVSQQPYDYTKIVAQYQG